MDADRRVAELATRQHGRISTAQLIDAGLSRSAIRHRVASGLLHRIHRGVFAVGHRAATPLGREAAALLACGQAAPSVTAPQLCCGGCWRAATPMRWT